MGRWPIKPTKVWEVYKEAVLDANRVVGLAISGDAQLVALASENISGPIHQVPLPGTNRVMDRGNSSHDLDITVHFVQPDEQELAAVSLERAGSSPWVLAVDDGPAASGEAVPLGPDSVRVSFKDTPEGWASVRAAVIDLADTASMSLARRYASFRPAVSRRVIEKTARQNAVVGAAFFFPGADMPVMTLNQIKMIFSLAAIHDQEISEDRALELAGTLGAGFGLRAIGRQVGAFVPGPGWIYKGVVGYSGTKALGEAALRYFRSGAVLTPERIVSEVRRLKR